MHALLPLLERVFGRADPRRLRAVRLRLRWTAIAGAHLAARTRVRLEGDVVVVETDDARWAREVKQLEPVLRERIVAGVGPIGAIEVRVVRAPAAAPAPAAEAGTAIAEIAAAPPAVAAAAEHIADAELRAKVLRVATLYLGSRRGRGRV